MSVDECIESVQKLQKYKGKKTAGGFMIKSVIIGPADAAQIDAFVKAHLKPNTINIGTAINSVDEYEPWVLFGKMPVISSQKFKDAFPHAE
jgi:hypothetical protein